MRRRQIISLPPALLSPLRSHDRHKPAALKAKRLLMNSRSFTEAAFLFQKINKTPGWKYNAATVAVFFCTAARPEGGCAGKRATETGWQNAEVRVLFFVHGNCPRHQKYDSQKAPTWDLSLSS